ncbi:MAG: CBS domain-containing protein [Bacteroidetes bacterium]|nr:CBS domain-containing protein [Bacteroidota bacterium]
MKKKEPVALIMTSNVLSVDVSDALTDAERIMTNNHIRHIPVVSNGALVGMLSLTDLLRLSFVESYGGNEEAIDEAVYEMLSIDQIMVTHPRSIDVHSSILEVAEILVHNEYHALPVTSDDKLAGIVTTTDVIRYFLEKA